MIHFVGAGPGAVDLITVRGEKLLQAADVIVYAGSLVNPDLLNLSKSDATVYNSATMTLAEVTDVMITAAKEGKDVVRLHTGEPSIYGAVREQMDLLEEAGIAYDSCPGVSACFGAAAAMNLEFTLPGVTQTLIISRMSGKTAVPEAERMELLAAHHASMAVYLSAGMTEELSKELIRGGYAPDTPALIAYKATWPEERYLPCTIATLHETALAAKITKTALILIGDAITHSDFERSKLYDPSFATGFREAR